MDSLDFVLLQTGTDGDSFAAVECRKEHKNLISVPKMLLPFGMPDLGKPITNLVENELMRCLTDEHPDPSFQPQRFWEREVDIESLYSLSQTPLETTIEVERNPANGTLLGFFEIEIKKETSEKVENIDAKKVSLDAIFKEDSAVSEIFAERLLDVPPGFDHGLEIASKGGASFNVSNLLLGDDHINPGPGDEVAPDDRDDVQVEISSLPKKDVSSDVIKSQVKFDKDKSAKSPEEKWAEVVDINQSLDDFHKLIPDPPHKWPFELDSFQKHAVLRLERGESVFVAAHTSAGKTVVAEYAIALTAKHMTRVVYTSPIKALSNQKFRDFKQTFSDVGLITGDVQICPEAFCLIMTTEILRSMLYNGSDVIRDLEWVIFDEVHYINDSERGVVWEEVLIMLPEHCNIILLSATVPNAFEFANWIGRTKQRKIFVISTLKRPVPLEHHLYTGNSTKSSNEMFMLVDSNRRFLKDGYKKAMNAKNERTSKHSRSFGAKNRTGGSDKGVWLSLIGRLRKRDQLPVVAFTFSRRRCDDNAVLLDSLDLTSTSEKREIKIFFEKCIRRLKGTDRSLPQVLQMAALLDRGVGTHHSGILPILKEVVEMLFARGLVKLLFATETFAMGVNMPARTVVFDSIRKHDGTQMRNLLPGEYVQMAGRAGRRGLDSTGNVIILCKGDVPEMAELHTMMLGRVTRLQSQFRLTYGMILNLLRVEQLRVEEVMRKSFSEFNTRKNSKIQEEELKSLKSEMASRSDVEDLLRRTDYEQYYLSCTELYSLRTRVLEELLSSNPRIMTSGRVIVVDLPSHHHHAAVVLKTNTSTALKQFVVLLLADDVTNNNDVDSNRWDRDCVLLKSLHRPRGSPTQLLLEVKIPEIYYVTTKVIKVQADTIIADCKKRQLPRFRSDPIDQSTSLATQQLMRLVDAHPSGLPEINAKSELGTNTVELVESISKIKSLELSINECFQCVELPRFNSQMEEVEIYLQLKNKFCNLKYLLSDESLFLLPEYHQRVKVLETLHYVDTNGAVQMKGRVSCEISTQELLLTELVFENVLSPFESSEIVALLSCCVFQQNVDMDEVTLTARLKEGMQHIIDVGEMIGRTQIECGMRESPDDFVSALKFGLVEVVHEWARGTPFKDITNLTSVQEGVIVRTIQRLSELCKDVRNAARVIGDPTLYAKMDKCSELVKRDIVFAASLYTH